MVQEPGADYSGNGRNENDIDAMTVWAAANHYAAAVARARPDPASACGVEALEHKWRHAHMGTLEHYHERLYDVQTG